MEPPPQPSPPTEPSPPPAPSLALASPSMPSQKRYRRRLNIIDPQPGTSFGEVQPPPPLSSPQKKRKRSIISAGEKEIIINIYKHVKYNKSEDTYMSNQDIVKKTSEISGMSERSIYRILSQYRETHMVTQPQIKRTRKNIFDKMDDFSKSAIRRIVHSFFLKGELPTAKKNLQEVNADENLEKIGITSLRQILKKLKFKYIRRDRKSLLIDRPEIVIWRMKYLDSIKAFRQENRRIFYTDETWINAGHTVGKVWVDTEIKSARMAFKEGLTTGAKAPTSKGQRLIVVHIGNEDGFLEECDWVFEAKKTGDYHENMDAPHYEEWFAKVLGKLQSNDVIVLDNASYHSRRLEKTPTISWKKETIQNWLHTKHISFEKTETKAHLMEKVKLIKGNFQTYVIDNMAAEKNVTVLRLPPYHCELNPIELVWADIKGYVARNNTTFKFSDLKGLLSQGIAQMTPEKWKNCVEHVKKEEVKMRGLDHKIDETVDKFIINVTDSSDSSCSCTDGSDTDSE